MTHHKHPNFTLTVTSTDIDGDILVAYLQDAINANAADPSSVVQVKQDPVVTVSSTITAPKASEDEQATYDYIRAALDTFDSEAVVTADPAL